jgi:hypothetical protein
MVSPTDSAAARWANTAKILKPRLSRVDCRRASVSENEKALSILTASSEIPLAMEMLISGIAPKIPAPILTNAVKGNG